MNINDLAHHVTHSLPPPFECYGKVTTNNRQKEWCTYVQAYSYISIYT